MVSVGHRSLAKGFSPGAGWLREVRTSSVDSFHGVRPFLPPPFAFTL
jgi:hypothetical protein